MSDPTPPGGPGPEGPEGEQDSGGAEGADGSQPPPPPPPGWGTPPPVPPGVVQPYGQPPYEQPTYGEPTYGQAPGTGQPPYPQPGPGVPYPPPGQPYGQHEQHGPYGPYGQAPPPQYGAQPAWFPTGPVPNNKAQWSLGIGLTAIVGACCSTVLGLVGIVAIVMGVQARREIAASAGRQTGGGMAVAGIVTGALAVGLSVVMGLLLVAMFASASGV